MIIWACIRSTHTWNRGIHLEAFCSKILGSNAIDNRPICPVKCQNNGATWNSSWASSHEPFYIALIKPVTLISKSFSLVTKCGCERAPRRMINKWIVKWGFGGKLCAVWWLLNAYTCQIWSSHITKAVSLHSSVSQQKYPVFPFCSNGPSQCTVLSSKPPNAMWFRPNPANFRTGLSLVQTWHWCCNIGSSSLPWSSRRRINYRVFLANEMNWHI